MAGNSFGQAFRVTTAGESHGPANLVIIDGCPPGLMIDQAALQYELSRRRPGQSQLVSQRREPDHAEILSGVFEGRTTGTSLSILIPNQDQRPKDYEQLKHVYRPGHADYSYEAKYGLRDPRGGGRASARETNVRVAAGAIAKQLIAQAFGGEVLGYVKQVGKIQAEVNPEEVSLTQIEQLSSGATNSVRCPDHAAALRMIELIESTRKNQDSIGGVAEIVARNIPAGLGEPVFGKLKAELAQALFSIPAVVGVEFGAGFSAAEARGSEQNDEFYVDSSLTPPQVRTHTNHHGGILGGISTGMPILMRAAVKPTSSIPRAQRTLNRELEAVELKVGGRHDPCLLPRFVPIAEAMVAIVLADHWLRQRGQLNSLTGNFP